MKYYIIAGEASGDLHAAKLMKSIAKKDTNAQFRFWGGDLMEKEGGDLVKHYRDLAYMGFVEVALNIRIILKNISFCKKDILEYQPDAVILVDYPGFNLRMAEFAKNEGFKVIYYISPQIWAWKKSRVKKIRKYVDKMLVILPFEKDFYAKYDVEVDFVGHPLLDDLAENKVEGMAEFLKKNKLDHKPIVALLPGSRKMEVERMLGIMVQVVDYFPDHQFVIAGVTSLSEHVYGDVLGKSPVKVITNQTRDLLFHADAALVTSGTATLETALIGVPEVVCYKGNWLSFEIARRIIDVKYISLVNLIMDKLVVKELIQNQLTVKNLTEELDKLLNDEVLRASLTKEYALLKEKLGKQGASVRAASLMLDFLNK